MNPSQNTGYASLERGRRLTPFSYDPPELKDNAVRIAITHCGVCASDIQAIDDFYNITDYPWGSLPRCVRCCVFHKTTASVR
jgi:D-arabinose 1-dehydrogenase-like Zn-dependent alcohol dehydrogenase